jgi:hypothetical protein
MDEKTTQLTTTVKQKNRLPTMNKSYAAWQAVDGPSNKANL